MRTFLTITLVLGLSACASKKKAPQAPGNTATETAPAGGAADEEKDMKAPDDADDARPMGSSDPCEGGE